MNEEHEKQRDEFTTNSKKKKTMNSQRIQRNNDEFTTNSKKWCWIHNEFKEMMMNSQRTQRETMKNDAAEKNQGS